MPESTGAPPLTCAGCDKRIGRTPQSRPQGEAMCHPCRRNRRKELTCSACGKPMYRNPRSSLPQGEATCLACRRARPKQHRAPKPRRRTCPMCRRTFEHNRRTYCSTFCRLVGSRLGSFRDLVRMEGGYQPARWWMRTDGDPRWIIGPPQTLLDVWITTSDIALCPFCGESLGYPIPAGVECHWCCIKIAFLANG